MSTHGGYRKGAGRKPGSAGAATTKTRAIANKAAAEGTTPLEAMLKTMVAFMDQADQAKKAGDDEKALKLMVSASSVAKDAAPYIHPRLQAIEHTGAGGGPMQYEAALAVIAGELSNMTDEELDARVQDALRRQ